MDMEMTEPEKQVAEFLRELGLWYKYEFPVFLYDDKERPRLWEPDFFLPKLGLYVEVCGSEEPDYTFREKIYYKNEICVIFLHCYKEEKTWKQFLIDRLESIREKRSSLISEAIKRAADGKTTIRKVV